MSVNFFDSNVLIYMFDEKDQDKKETARSYIASALKARDSVISHQVVQETLNVITRRHATLATEEEANHFFTTTLMPLWKINPSRRLYQKALGIQARYQYGFYDSLIIAAALEADCETLYSEDMQHGQIIEGLTIQDPFRNEDG